MSCYTDALVKQEKGGESIGKRPKREDGKAQEDAQNPAFFDEFCENPSFESRENLF